MHGALSTRPPIDIAILKGKHLEGSAAAQISELGYDIAGSRCRTAWDSQSTLAMPTTGFNADPVISKPTYRLRTSDAIGQPISSEIVAGLASGTKCSQSSYFQPEGSAVVHSASGLISPVPSPSLPVQLDPRQPGFQATPDAYQASPTRSSQSFGAPEWSVQQSQLQQLLDQQALLSQLQSQMQLNQAQLASNAVPPQQSGHQQLLNQQLQPPTGLADGARQTIEVSHAPFSHQGLPQLPPQWHPGAAANLPPPALPDLQSLKHPMYMLHDDKKHSRLPHAMKSRQLETDTGQAATLDKLRREVTRLHSESERLEKEVGRQKALRETERVEFTDAKDRLKQSWAADRDDFARVKAMLKAKNAEHHAQSSRLSQQLKEIEGVNRGLRELCARHGVTVPAELEISLSKHHALAHHSSSSGPGSYLSSSSSQLSTSTNPSSQLSMIATSREMPPPLATSISLAEEPSVGDSSIDSDLAERVGPGQKPSPRATASRPPSPTSAADAIMSMLHQLPKLLKREQSIGDGSGEQAASDAHKSAAASQAAAQAAAALDHLASALKIGQAGKPSTAKSASSEAVKEASSTDEEGQGYIGRNETEGTDLNRMSLQSWVSQDDAARSKPSQRCPEDISAAEKLCLKEGLQGSPQPPPTSSGLEFPKVGSGEASPFEREAKKPPFPPKSDSKKEGDSRG